MIRRLSSMMCVSLAMICTAGCASTDPAVTPSHAGIYREATPLIPSQEIEELILALDPDSLSGSDVAEILSRGPAPRIINFNGSIPVISMDSFSRFLIAMGYPEQSVRDPRNGAYSYSSYQSSEKMAGMIAWFYEHEGMMPLLIGHSQGGMVTMKVLHELAGAFRPQLAVWNPYTGEYEKRHAIVDPLSGQERPVIGLRVGFASAIATGRLMRLLLGQWDMLSRLRQVPDTVEEFTGFHIPHDVLGSGLTFSEGAGRYRPVGSAFVRNVWLPATYNHITIPLTEDLARDPRTRKWIERYRPGVEQDAMSDNPGSKADNALFAAELWHRTKKYWCVELQRLIRAKRMLSAAR